MKITSPTPPWKGGATDYSSRGKGEVRWGAFSGGQPVLRAIAFLALLTVVSGCGSLFFYPKKQLYVNPLALQFSPQDVYFKSSDNTQLHGWLFSPPDSKGLILVLHGNAENLSTHVNSVLWLVKEGYSVFIFDYRGYGRSEGKPDIAPVHRDADAALKFALTLSEANNRKIVVLGQSVGGAIAVYTVAHSPEKDRIAALIIDSAFSSYRKIAREKLGGFFLTWPFQYPLSFLVSDSYSPVRCLKEVSPVSLLILHGENDPVVPIHHGKILYEAATEPKEFLQTPEPGHVMSFADSGVRQHVLEFIAKQLEKK
jgi:alpha-beta hydrolase superfamily lysophospholipase